MPIYHQQESTADTSVMAHYEYPARGIISYPHISTQTMLYISPFHFLREIIMQNPHMPCYVLTTDTVKDIYIDMLAKAQHQISPFDGLKIRQQRIVEQVSLVVYA